MTFKNAIGIDVSKATLQVCNHQSGEGTQISNDPNGFAQLLKWSNSVQENIFCFEHTGMYSLPLAIFLAERKLPFVMVPGLEIKRSLGLVRGKSDRIDAKHLARYAYLRREELVPSTLPSKSINKLKSLLNLREKMVRQRAGYQSTVKELRSFAKMSNKDILLSAQLNLIKTLKKQIQKIEDEIKETIKGDPHLNKLFKLVTSVKGVGLILGTSFLVYTNCFIAFDDWRKFASYSGIAPFDYQSGSSIRASKRVHRFANKKLKSLLSNAATTSIQFNPEMKLYYERRIHQGKSKMSTLNIIRNKIVARVFAVVKRGTPYAQTMAFS